MVSAGMETSFSCVLRSCHRVLGGWWDCHRALIIPKHCHHLVSMGWSHTYEGHRLLRLQRSIWHSQSFAGRFRGPLPMCGSVESHDGCRYSCKECVQDLTPHHCYLMYLLIKPCLPGNQILCIPLCARNSPSFPVTI